MKWLKNLENIAENNPPGACPYCGSDDTDSTYVISLPEKNMGSLKVWCNSCKKALHVSRAFVPQDVIKKEIPKNLDYL